MTRSTIIEALIEEIRDGVIQDLREEVLREARREFGRLGGLARAAKMTPEARQALAKKAIATRWAKHKKKR